MDIYKSAISNVKERIYTAYLRGRRDWPAQDSYKALDFDIDEALYPALKQLFEEEGFIVETADCAHDDPWMICMRLESKKDFLIRMSREENFNDNNKRFRE